MVDRYETIIGYRYDGQSEIQNYLSDLSRVATQTQAFERIGTVRGSAFEGLAKTSRSVSDINSLLGTSVRQYDMLLQRVAQLRVAENQRLSAQRALNVRGENRITDPIARENLDLKSRIAVNAASERLARAYLKAQESVEREAQAAQRRALMGPMASTMFKDDGSLNVDKSRGLDKTFQTSLTQSRRQAAEQERADQRRRDDEFESVHRAGLDAERELQRERDGQARLNAQRRDQIFERVHRAGQEEARAVEDAAMQRRRTGQQLMAGRAAFRETQKQNAIFDAFEPTYANPNLNSPLGQTQAGVNRAERALEIATLARTNIMRDSTSSALQRQRAEQAYQNALTSLTTAQRRVTTQLASQQMSSRAGGLGGARQDFMTGFHGRGDRPYAEQIGQAFKFSVFYGTAYKMLFALTATLQQTLQEGIEFQKAMTELKIASGASADAAAEMADGLAAQATMAGAAPSQGVMLGARSLGLFGATESSGASLAEQERIAEISARVVSRMALGSKTDPMELQTQIAAVANAFGGGAQGQIRAYDLDAYLGRRFGVMPGETIQSVAESGTVGQAAGFNQEEVFAIAAALQSRTGQTSSAVAGWMAQIFSRGGEGSLTALTGKHGIDQSADLATQVQELARIYKQASNTERAEIAAGFGRGKVQNAAVVMLDEFDSIMREATSARTEATGEGDKIFELRMDDIGGQIQQTIAVMKAFASELGQSGLLDIVGGVVIAFRELVEAATSVLQLWNELPGALKASIASLILFANATRIASALGGASLAARGGAVGTTFGNAMGVAGPATAAAAGSSGFLAAGKAALRFAGPVGIAITGLLAVGALKQSSDRMREAQESAEEALRSSGLTPDSTSSDYIASASELDSLAQQNRDATGGFHNAITFGNADDDNIEIARALEAEARRRREVADAIDARAAANPVKPAAIASFEPDAIKEALDLITASGGDANDRLRLLTEALDGTGDAAVRAAAVIGEDFAGRMATAFKDGVGEITEEIPWSERISTPTQFGTADERRGVEYQVTPDRYVAAGRGPGQLVPGETRTIGEVFEATQTELEDRLREEMTKRNIESLADLDKGTSKELAEEIVNDSDFDDRLSGDQFADARKRVVNMIARQLRGEALQWRKMLKKNNDLTAVEVAALGESIDASFDAKLDEMPETDLAGRAKVQRARLRRLLQTRSQAGEGEEIDGLIRRIGNARSQVAQTEIQRLEQVRRAQQQNARSAAGIRRAGMRSMRAQIAAAIKGGDRDDLAEVISRTGSAGIAIARAIIQQAIEAARMAREIFLQIEAVKREAQGLLAQTGAELGYIRGGVPGKVPNAPRLNELTALDSALGDMTHGDGKTFTEGSDVEGTDKYFPDPEKGKSPEDKKAEREAARQEMLDLKNNLYLLSIDLSDPLAMAVAAVKDARRRLQSDVASGQSKGTVAASRVALRQAEIEKEATAFQQRLEAVQTAEELGRISHRKYISYLESERKRLGAIKHRTYQQQQQLDEIDRLMKDSAESMQGMWNFGDIKLPTPYQVKRQVESMRLDRATQLDGVSNRAVANSTIYIDGADTGKVRQIIAETLGRANATVTNKPRRR